MQDDHRSLVRRQPAEAPIQLVSIDDRTDRVDGDRFMGWAPRHAVPMPAAAPGLVHAAADEEPMQPGIEAVGIAEGRQVAPGTHECLLDRVLGLVRFVEDQPCDRIESGESRSDEHGEGVMIASSRPIHELSLHPDLGVVA